MKAVALLLVLFVSCLAEIHQASYRTGELHKGQRLLDVQLKKSPLYETERPIEFHYFYDGGKDVTITMIEATLDYKSQYYATYRTTYNSSGVARGSWVADIGCAKCQYLDVVTKVWGLHHD